MIHSLNLKIPKNITRKKLYKFSIVIIIFCLIVFLVRIISNYKDFDIRNRASTTDVNSGLILVANAQGKFGYAYAPTIIKADGEYHAFFCSQGDYAWDYIRYVHSSDGVNWSLPVVKVRATNHNHIDMAACDPSLIYYQGPNDTKPYYYLYYTGATAIADSNNNPSDNNASIIYVARSETINGDYIKYSKDATGKPAWLPDTWKNPPAPLIPIPVVKTLKDHLPSTQSSYGVGQETVVVKDGVLNMWYTDNSYPNGTTNIYYIKSIDPLNWTPNISNITNIGFNSMDVKYDPNMQKFVTIGLVNMHGVSSYPLIKTSSDGFNWSNGITLRPSLSFPDFSNNSGFSSDKFGNIIPGEPVLFGFAAPYTINLGDNSNDTWGKWNLYGLSLNYNEFSSAPYGDLNTVSCEITMGWACDPSDYSKPVQVHIYKDGPAGSGTFVGSTLADKNREIGVQQACGNVNSAHGFSFPIPDTLRDGNPHSIYIHAINIGENAPNPLLSNTPQMLTCAKLTPSPTKTPTPIATKLPTPTTKPTATKVPTLTPTKVITLTPTSISHRGYGDLNGDNKVNILDLSELASNWGKTYASTVVLGSRFGDVNGDFKVDILDLSNTATNWGKSW